MKYYIEYTLGIKGHSGKKADKGTITHKILEICAICKKAIQDGHKVIEDEDIGEVFTDQYDPEYLASIASRVYSFYTDKFSHHKWYKKDFEDCLSWTWKTLKYEDGLIDPMNRNVVEAEPFFDFEIKKEWAEYEYPEYNLRGHLALKGAIDLVTDLGDNVYESIDYKTGAYRKDWATGKEKNQKNIKNDPQLRLYHYALTHLYPHVHTFLVTIYFVNAGGIFTVHFDDSDLEKTEKMIRKRFEFIRDTEQPSLIRKKDPTQFWKCQKLCNAGMNNFDKYDHVNTITESRPGQLQKRGEKMNICEQVRYEIKRKGIDWVTQNYIHPDHFHGAYGSGGGKERDGKDKKD